MPGQSLSEIRSLLAGAGLAPHHRFGQNFLIDLNLMRKLVAAAEVGPDDVVLEVGPGTGSLTEMLLERGAQVIAVEIDRGLHRLLIERLNERTRLTLIHGDALSGKHAINPHVLDALREHKPGRTGRLKLVANLPYQIATPLLIDLLWAEPRVDPLTFTIQREVGDRLRAGVGETAYGPVSVIVQTFATVELVGAVPPDAFWPKPKIDSVMLRVVGRLHPRVSWTDAPDFAALVQRGFGQRRKMLGRLIGTQLSSAAFDAAEVSPNCRPEQVSAGQWAALFLALLRSEGRA